MYKKNFDKYKLSCFLKKYFEQFYEDAVEYKDPITRSSIQLKPK